MFFVKTTKSTFSKVGALALNSEWMDSNLFYFAAIKDKVEVVVVFGRANFDPAFFERGPVDVIGGGFKLEFIWEASREVSTRDR